jgi:hypothetical protein
MANVDRPRGFRPAKSLIGAPWNSLVREYPAADRSADTTLNHGDIYIGDPVKLVAGEVLPANSADAAMGVVVGIGVSGGTTFGPTGYFNPNDLGQRYLAAADSGIVAVVPAEHVIFGIQTASDLDLVPGDVADHNLTANLAHGDQTTGNSNVELVASVNANVTVVETPDSPENDATLANATHFVRFNTTQNPA